MKKYALKLLNFYTLLALLFLVSVYGIFHANKISTQKKRLIVQQLESSSSQPKPQLSDYQRLIESKKPIECSFSTQLPNSKIAGNIYSSENKIRTDITAPTKSGKDRLSHSIFMSDTIYNWYEGDAMGIKIDKKAFDERNKQSVDKNDTYTDPNSLIESLATYNTLNNGGGMENNLDCKEWETDDLKFVLPPSVSFIDGVAFYNELDRQLCLKCDAETTEASRLLCRKTLQCK